MTPFMGETPLLRVRDLVTSFRTESGVLRAVDEVSFEVPEGATLGIVGESGCGKSVTALSVLRLIPYPQGAIESGSIELRGKDLLALSEREMQDVRGNAISMIFQEPMTSLNPVYTVGAQIVEAIRLHQKKSRGEARKKAIGPFKRELWSLPEDVRTAIAADLERTFAFLFEQLNVNGTADHINRFVRAPVQHHAALKPALVTAVDDAEAGE